ncbi:MAG: hypothetical protein SF052_04285, partial [Bacteroidia bacterium]|nr:hypothetical protein [Bacteroidia bacterium]
INTNEMKRWIWILGLLIISVTISACKKVPRVKDINACQGDPVLAIYMLTYAKTLNSFFLNIDDGEFIYKETFWYGGTRDLKLIKHYCPPNDEVKIYFRANGRDTLMVIPIENYKEIGLGVTIKDNFLLLLDDDDWAWINY